MSEKSTKYWNQHREERLKNLEIARAVKKGILKIPAKKIKTQLFPHVANKLRMLFKKEDETVFCGCGCGAKIVNQDTFMVRHRAFILGHNTYRRGADFYSKLSKSYRRSASKPERVLCKIISDNKLPLKFTGLGHRKEYWFGNGNARSSKTINPDFIGIGFPLVIEEQGVYFHNIEKTKRKDLQKRLVLEAHGFNVRYIWENDLVKWRGVLPLSENEIVSRIKNWITEASDFSIQMGYVFGK